jgi:hypothetical protein
MANFEAKYRGGDELSAGVVVDDVDDLNCSVAPENPEFSQFEHCDERTHSRDLLTENRKCNYSLSLLPRVDMKKPLV